jgi:hypothetical protein
MLKPIIQKILKGIILFLILIFQKDSFVFMESVDEKLLENEDSPKFSWYEFFYKHQYKILISVFSLSILLGMLFTTEIDKILWDIKSITNNAKFFDSIKSYVSYLDLNKSPENQANTFKILRKLLEEPLNYEKVTAPEKFKKLIEKLIEELKKDKD